MKIIIFVTILIATISATTIAEEHYSAADCMLDHMPGVSTEKAYRIVYESCMNDYPPTPEIAKLGAIITSIDQMAQYRCMRPYMSGSEMNHVFLAIENSCRIKVLQGNM